MKIDLKNIMETYLRDRRDGPVCPVCTDEPSEYSPLNAIARFLADHKLPLTSKNLELGWELVCGNNRDLKTAIDRASTTGRLDNHAALEIHNKYLNTDINGQIETIFWKALAQIRDSTQIMSAGSENAIKHESQLMEQADNIRGGKYSLENAIQKMLNLSQLMVESTRENQKQISHTNEKLAELQNELEVARSEADHDKLTRLPNRRKFDRDLEAVFQRLQDDEAPFVLAFVDVDHFKRINDTFGHECGDRVLRMIANQLSLLANKRCKIARYGGEEFAILFEDDDLDDIFAKVDACRSGLASKLFVDVGTGRSIGQVTFSVGMAQCLPSDTKRSLLRKADVALYNAKSEGRNIVRQYSNDIEERMADQR